VRRFALMVATVGSALFLMGCPPKPVYPNCNNDENCTTEGRSEVCIEGRCVECATDNQCQRGFRCQNNRCVPPTECDANRPCPGGGVCTPGGKCVQCMAETDCPQGQLCRNNACVAKPAGYCTDSGDCGSGESCQNNRCVESEDSRCRFEPIRFGFNESSLASLEPEMRQRLDSAAQCLKRNPRQVTLEGHADERGTDEYNLQLSERRAAAVRRYLTELGVSGDRIRVVGFGENRPAVEGSSESAYAANRRVEFNVR
jgi:peptidoglycan-associated lipoprotein